MIPLSRSSNPQSPGGADMQTNGQTEARKLHASLSHPVIDADGHWIEYGPVMREEFRRIGGEAAVEAYEVASQRVPNSLKMTLPERRRRRVGQEAFWSSPSENVLDRATAMLPRLMYERLDDLGIDFSVVYPTAGLSYHRMQDTRLRRAICRAYNVFTADQFREFNDRIVPAAIIPMYTPEEAIEEIEFAVRQLGYKVIMVGGLMRRPVPALAEERPDAASLVEWYDVIGLDSDHDYDPVWEKCRELRIAPSALDRAKLHELARKYGRDGMTERLARGEGLEADPGLTGGVEDVDDYFRCKIGRKDDLRELFVPRFYFGCEADDPINAWAFNRQANPMGARLNALFSSDIGHFDVPDMAEVVPEAYELVEHGLLTDDDFRDFMFANAVRFWGEVNPDFFRGTVVEKAAADVLGNGR